jgi:hypothetical protein
MFRKQKYNHLASIEKFGFAKEDSQAHLRPTIN